MYENKLEKKYVIQRCSNKNKEYYQLIKPFRTWAEYTYKFVLRKNTFISFIIKNDKSYSFNLKLYIFKNVEMWKWQFSIQYIIILHALL